VEQPVQAVAARSSHRRIRVLHVLGSLRPGGVETWLLQALAHVDRERFAFDFLVHDASSGSLEPDVVALGARIHRCPHVRNPVRYARCLGRILDRDGPYDAVHSHVHAYSGFVLAIAARHGVAMRIAHAHTSEGPPPLMRSPSRFGYAKTMRMAIGKLATHGLACATTPARDLFGPDWSSDPRWRVLRCGVDPARFESAQPAESVRRPLDLDDDALVVGHVGNFHAVKNHRFLLRVFEAVVDIHPRSCLVCVGDGPLLEGVRADLRGARIHDRVRLLGVRRDVPELMRRVFDVFVLPSRVEGLPLALIEAQAARLPCVVSDVVTPEADVRASAVARLGLDEPVETWARAIVSFGLDHRAAPRVGPSPIAGTDFDIRNGARGLESLYAEARSRSEETAC